MKAAYACPPQLVKHGSIEYFSASQMQKIVSRNDGMLIEAESVYERFRVVYSEKGFLEELVMASNNFTSPM